MERKACFFKKHGITRIDYRDVALLRKFLSPHGRLLSRRRTGCSALAQRALTRAVKQARFMAFLPYIEQ